MSEPVTSRKRSLSPRAPLDSALSATSPLRRAGALLSTGAQISLVAGTFAVGVGAWSLPIMAGLAIAAWLPDRDGRALFARALRDREARAATGHAWRARRGSRRAIVHAFFRRGGR